MCSRYGYARENKAYRYLGGLAGVYCFCCRQTCCPISVIYINGGRPGRCYPVGHHVACQQQYRRRRRKVNIASIYGAVYQSHCDVYATVGIHFKCEQGLRARILLRLVTWIGRWSMLDLSLSR
ncbi:hypothetical protein KCP77_13065 [Salmonella enterica subsp. enterica]|nr:hypothetical protein KCP77_13065 [Salmonella enterica subsp. enterica]